MKMIKRIKNLFILVSMVTLLSGLVLVIWPATSASTICLLIGILLTISGLVRIIGYFTDSLYQLAFQFDLSLGILSIGSGILLILNPNWLMTALSIAIGVFLLVDSIFAIQTAIETCRFGIAYGWIILISAIASTFLAVLLIVEPFSGIQTLTMLLGISMMINSIKNITVAVFTTRQFKNMLPDQ